MQQCTHVGDREDICEVLFGISAGTLLAFLMKDISANTRRY
jgi:hypothetical protein